MMLGRLFLSASLCAISAGRIYYSGAVLGQDSNLPESDAEYPEQWFAGQQIDHFGISGNWKQRYFENLEFYKAGGPVFLMIGGEGPINSKSVTKGLYEQYNMAKKFGGALVTLEHRFYGKSQPFGSLALEYLPYLTSRQALADLATFAEWYEKKLEAAYSFHLNKSRVLCLGGSYAGNLAAWFRQLYPERSMGCFSSSGPVLAKEDFYEYGEVVYEALAADGKAHLAAKLNEGYMMLSEYLRGATPQVLTELAEKLNACEYSFVDPLDIDNVENLSNAISDVVQYNNTANLHISDMQDLIEKAATPLEAVFKVSRFLGKINTDKSKCTDFSVRNMYKNMTTSDPEDENAAMRAWTWQTCNEFGYFQTMRVASLNENRRTMFTYGVSNPAFNQGICYQVFKITPEEIAENIQRINSFYGALNPGTTTKVFYAHGELDPWARLGIKEIHDEGKQLFAHVVPGGSHCAGLYDSEQTHGHAGTADVHEKLHAYFARWGELQISDDNDESVQHPIFL